MMIMITGHDDNDSYDGYQDSAEGCEEEDGGCHPRMLHGDNRLVQFNLQSNSWTNRGYLGRDNQNSSHSGFQSDGAGHLDLDQ